MEQRKYLTVSDINLYVKQKITSDNSLKRVFVKGEISNFTDHARLGHLYFTLKDDKCAVKAVMFKWSKQKLKFTPQNGMNVVIAGSVNVYERDGIFQIVAEDMIPYGEGALNIAYEQLKQKLMQEGLFDESHKKKIPVIPKRIGVITAKKSAALQDIINILSRRYPLATLVVIDSLVQGDNAPKCLCEALESCKELGLDTVIIGRGGGSLEDLWAFNDEMLARAVYNCEIPIISAVGHETDFTICDFVADLRAPTPSAAAELATPSVIELHKFIDNKQKILYNSIAAKLERYRLYHKTLAAVLSAKGPEHKIAIQSEAINGLVSRLKSMFDRDMFERQKKFSGLISKLDVLSPLRTMSRGFSLTVNKQNQVVHSVKQVLPGDEIITKLSDGEIVSRAETLTEN